MLDAGFNYESGMAHMSDTAPRVHCYLCDKPQNMCICGDVRAVSNSVGIHILQHPRERRHALGTVRLLRLSLARIQVHTLELLGDGGLSRAVELPADAGLLYLTDDARDLATLGTGEAPGHLVVIDGTWAHANRIFQDKPWVAQLPRFKLSPQAPSRYRIRPAPHSSCLSTVESVIQALRHLEPALTGTERIEAAFDRMIDAQIDAFSSAENPGRHRRIRHRQSLAIPGALTNDQTCIVIVYGEPSPLRDQDRTTRHPIRFSAQSLWGDRAFDGFVHSEIVPDAYECGQMGLSSDALDSAQPLETMVATFRAFCQDLAQGRPVVLVSWGHWTHRWCLKAFDDLTCVRLKKVWANVSRASVPNLDVLVGDLGLATDNPEVSGRAGRRLACARALTQHVLTRGSHVR
ncbi:MAG: tRNA-uridine aminocarboxypropyltransferase [Myxococcota bacterium]|nr:tRNA-uridine aminocarboxypropyltransferase [Myxococcota bacterium]